jgi:hypothetical protein
MGSIRMDLREIGLGGCGLDSTGTGKGLVAACCTCGDEPSSSCATELVSSCLHRKSPFLNALYVLLHLLTYKFCIPSYCDSSLPVMVWPLC